MSQLQPVRGTHDLFFEDNVIFRHINNLALETAALYGFSEISTPIFEYSQVFCRTLGETSDVVTKEMYTFTDRGGEQITLRPEGTAGIARAVISEGLHQNLPLKYYYFGPMFRYERPQKGRQRQFHQLGTELLGVPTPQADLEVISLATRILNKLGLNHRFKLELNTIGDTESRNLYRTALIEYLEKFRSDLSEDSKQRLDRNPLRVLDSKDEKDKVIVADAPLFHNYLNSNSLKFFDEIKMGLNALEINYEINQRLVRGLDYYCHTVFEFTTEELGSQATILAGGRYDGLIELMGGKPTPGVGWAAGVERLAMLVKKEKTIMADLPIAIIPLGKDAELVAFKLAEDLRNHNFVVDISYSGNVGKRMKRADKLKAPVAILIGEDEIKNKTLTVRNLVNGEQKSCPQGQALFDELSTFCWKPIPTSI